jgi:hypothetical protein
MSLTILETMARGPSEVEALYDGRPPTDAPGVSPNRAGKGRAPHLA